MFFVYGPFSGHYTLVESKFKFHEYKNPQNNLKSGIQTIYIYIHYTSTEIRNMSPVADHVWGSRQQNRAQDMTGVRQAVGGLLCDGGGGVRGLV